MFQGQEQGFAFIAEPWPFEPDRPTLLFIHGAGMSKSFWARQVTGLSHAANCVAADLPGHGESLGPGAKTIDEYSDRVLEFVDLLCLGSPVLCGHSMGGAIAQNLLIGNPGVFRAGVLISTGARLKVLPLVFETLEKGMDTFADLTLSVALAEPHRTDAIRAEVRKSMTSDPAVAKDDFTACNAFDVMDRLSTIDMPVLVIGSSEDLSTPLKYSKYLADSIPGARLVVIDGAGHFAPIEKAGEVNAAIAGFLNRLA